MRTMHLFAGAGGGLLADLILGHQPVVAVEWDAYACAVLRERRDEGWFPGLHVHEGDIRLFDPSEWKGRVDCIHAGFPCQDISAAGKGAGITGSRSGLFSEVMRAVDAVRPGYVFLENSPEITRRGIEVVLDSLSERGYVTRWIVLGASDVGAKHIRKRFWALSNSDKVRFHCSVHGQPKKKPKAGGGYAGRKAKKDGLFWSVEPKFQRMVDGVAYWMERVACMGNGQVPLCAAVAFKMLWEEMSRETRNTEKAD